MQYIRAGIVMSCDEVIQPVNIKIAKVLPLVAGWLAGWSSTLGYIYGQIAKEGWWRAPTLQKRVVATVSFTCRDSVATRDCVATVSRQCRDSVVYVSRHCRDTVAIT